jgi:hypothetical protein
MNKRITGSLLTAVVMLFCCSCAKTKLNSLLQPSGAEVNTNSSIRLFNFYNFNLNVTINNVPLTSYSEGVGNGTTIGLSLFPLGSWQTADDGNGFFVPNTLVAKNRQVHVQISTATGITIPGSGGSTITLHPLASIDTVLTDDPLHPTDYYALSTGHLLVVPRNTEAPVMPDHFKIRIINLSDSLDPNNITGRMKLTYSDGSEVDPRLDTVSRGSTSAYVDLPYGAYQFKVFCNGDFTKQVAELPGLPAMDACAIGTDPLQQEGLWPKVRTFAPGGTYTIVISQTVQVFPACNFATLPAEIAFNGYRIITEQTPGPNLTYARMDAVNALPVVSLSVKVDGMTLGGTLPYAGHTDYSIYVRGEHVVQAVDGSGNVLVTKTITLAPYDNYTAWVYQTPSGTPDICFASTDMSSTLYQTVPVGNVASPGATFPIPPTDDGTDGSLRVTNIPYSWQTRFLNLTPDIPYVTFTNNVSTFPAAVPIGQPGEEQLDSLNFASASVNLPPGTPILYNPYVIFPYQLNYSWTASGFGLPTSIGVPASIHAYESTPGPPAVVPGTYLSIAGTLPGTAYISNPALYPGFVPVNEAGIYTTALIGKGHTATSDVDAIRFLILKHNK